MAQQNMEISIGEIQRRLKFVGFEADDRGHVIALKGLITKHADELTEIFFKFLSAVDEVKFLFENKDQLAKARTLQREHLIDMVSGEYEGSYGARRVALGMLYSTLGLAPPIFIGGFQQLLRAIGELIFKNTKVSETAFLQLMSLNKIAFFDIGVIVDVLVFEQVRNLRIQEAAVRELSTPVLQVRDQLLILPIIGILDGERARGLTESLLQAIRTKRAKIVVVDITGVAAVDSKVANHLVQTVAASRLMGALVIVTGVSAEVAQTLVTLGVDLIKLNTMGDLQGGIEEAERILGYKVTQTTETKNLLSVMAT